MSYSFKTKEEQIRAAIKFLDDAAEYTETYHRSDDYGGEYLDQFIKEDGGPYECLKKRDSKLPLTDSLKKLLKQIEDGPDTLGEANFDDILGGCIDHKLGGVHPPENAIYWFHIGECHEQIDGVSGQVNGQQTEDVWSELIAGLGADDIAKVQNGGNYYWDGKSNHIAITMEYENWYAVIDEEQLAQEMAELESTDDEEPEHTSEKSAPDHEPEKLSDRQKYEEHLMGKRPTWSAALAAVTPFYDDEKYEVDTWFERDRKFIGLKRQADEATVFDAWDEDAEALIEDGFYDPANDVTSLVDYAKAHGLIKPASERMPSEVKPEPAEEADASFVATAADKATSWSGHIKLEQSDEQNYGLYLNDTFVTHVKIGSDLAQGLEGLLFTDLSEDQPAIEKKWSGRVSFHQTMVDNKGSPVFQLYLENVPIMKFTSSAPAGLALTELFNIDLAGEVDPDYKKPIDQKELGRQQRRENFTEKRLKGQPAWKKKDAAPEGDEAEDDDKKQASSAEGEPGMEGKPADSQFFSGDEWNAMLAEVNRCRESLHNLAGSILRKYNLAPNGSPQRKSLDEALDKVTEMHDQLTDIVAKDINIAKEKDEKETVESVLKKAGIKSKNGRIAKADLKRALKLIADYDPRDPAKPAYQLKPGEGGPAEAPTAPATQPSGSQHSDSERMVTQWEVEDCGVQSSDYFQGRGTSGTEWEDVAVGIGVSPREAFSDALESLSQSGWDFSNADMEKDRSKLSDKTPDELDDGGDEDSDNNSFCHVAVYVTDKKADGDEDDLIYDLERLGIHNLNACMASLRKAGVRVKNDKIAKADLAKALKVLADSDTYYADDVKDDDSEDGEREERHAGHTIKTWKNHLGWTDLRIDDKELISHTEVGHATPKEAIEMAKEFIDAGGMEEGLFEDNEDLACLAAAEISSETAREICGHLEDKVEKGLDSYQTEADVLEALDDAYAWICGELNEDDASEAELEAAYAAAEKELVKTFKAYSKQRKKSKKTKSALEDDEENHYLRVLCDKYLIGHTFRVLKKMDSLHPEGTEITVTEFDDNSHQLKRGFGANLRGDSDQPEVGNDMWNVEWFTSNIEQKRLMPLDDNGDPDPRSAKAITKLAQEAEDLENEDPYEDDGDDLSSGDQYDKDNPDDDDTPPAGGKPKLSLVKSAQAAAAKANPAALEKKVKKILGSDFKIYEGYSGRGMMGKPSSFAFTTSTRPGSTEGQKLIKLGLSSDSLGMGFIYYTTAKVTAGIDLGGPNYEDLWDYAMNVEPLYNTLSLIESKTDAREVAEKVVKHYNSAKPRHEFVGDVSAVADYFYKEHFNLVNAELEVLSENEDEDTDDADASLNAGQGGNSALDEDLQDDSEDDEDDEDEANADTPPSTPSTQKSPDDLSVEIAVPIGSLQAMLLAAGIEVKGSRIKKADLQKALIALSGVKAKKTKSKAPQLSLVKQALLKAGIELKGGKVRKSDIEAALLALADVHVTAGSTWTDLSTDDQKNYQTEWERYDGERSNDLVIDLIEDDNGGFTVGVSTQDVDHEFEKQKGSAAELKKKCTKFGDELAKEKKITVQAIKKFWESTAEVAKTGTLPKPKALAADDYTREPGDVNFSSRDSNELELWYWENEVLPLVIKSAKPFADVESSKVPGGVQWYVFPDNGDLEIFTATPTMANEDKTIDVQTEILTDPSEDDWTALDVVKIPNTGIPKDDARAYIAHIKSVIKSNSLESERGVASVATAASFDDWWFDLDHCLRDATNEDIKSWSKNYCFNDQDFHDWFNAGMSPEDTCTEMQRLLKEENAGRGKKANQTPPNTNLN